MSEEGQALCLPSSKDNHKGLPLSFGLAGFEGVIESTSPSAVQ